MSILVGLALVVAAPAASCPLTAVVGSSIEQPKGWSAVTPEKRRLLRLKSVAFTFGHPSNRADVIPSTTRHGSDSQDRFYFGNGSKEVWIVCLYDTSGAGIARSVGKPTSCSVTYSGGAEKAIVKCSYSK